MPVKASVIGEIEVDRRDRDVSAGDRREVGLLVVAVARGVAVDPVALAPVPSASTCSSSWLGSRFPSRATSTPFGSGTGAILIVKRALGNPSAATMLGEAGRQEHGYGEVELPSAGNPCRRRRTVGDGDSRNTEHDALEHRRDRSR